MTGYQILNIFLVTLGHFLRFLDFCLLATFTALLILFQSLLNLVSHAGAKLEGGQTVLKHLRAGVNAIDQQNI